MRAPTTRRSLRPAVRTCAASLRHAADLAEVAAETMPATAARRILETIADLEGELAALRAYAGRVPPGR